MKNINFSTFYCHCACNSSLYQLRSFFTTKSNIKNQGKKVLLFFGVPGSGIGTFNNLLCKEYGLHRISLTDELRKIKEGNDYHIFSKELVDSIRNSLLIGKASDDVFMRVLESKYEEKESEKGVSIDGFPRSWKQMEAFERKYSLDLAINLIVDHSVLVEGMLGRRVCSKCHKSYNVCHIERNGYKLMPILPKKEGTCDICETHLEMKAEDNIQTIIARIDRYKKISHKMIDHIYKNYKVVDFAPKNGIKDFGILSNAVKNNLAFI